MAPEAYGEDSRREAGTTLRFWEGDHDQRPCFRDLIQVGKKLDLVGVLPQDVGFRWVVTLFNPFWVSPQ